MRQRKILRAKWFLYLAAVSLLLGSCAASSATGPSQAASPDRMEELLVQAGFKLFPETNPKCQALCRTLPPGQLVPHRKGDKLLYAYVTPDAKRLYAGNEAVYQRFINLAVMHQIEERDRPVADERTDPEFWNMWEDLHGGG